MISRKQGSFILCAILLSAIRAFAQASPTDTAYGNGALLTDANGPTGYEESAFGYYALVNTYTGNGNPATTGAYALTRNYEGGENVADGLNALYKNEYGDESVAIEANALYNNDGSWNVAIGTAALQSNVDGERNSAVGYNGLNSNSGGSYNTGIGDLALHSNIDSADSGSYNTATGASSLYSNTTGYNNTATGAGALTKNTTGSSNIAIGWQAGFNITSGSNNIEIGAAGAADANTIRLGTQGTQKATYIAGISGTALTGGDVVVSSSGQLGVLSSSVRYKTDIQALGERSHKLWQLRPVTFRYKQDPQGQRQYGLIAEEVAKVYPELVVHGNKGEIESVQYRELIPLMLNEMQHEQAALAELKAQNLNQQAALNELKIQNQVLRAALAQQNTALQARLERLEQTSRASTLASR